MDYHALFLKIDSFLVQTEALWRYQPFQHLTQSFPSSRYPWRDEYVLVSQFLDNIANDEISSLRENHGDSWLDALLPELAHMRRMAKFPLSHSSSSVNVSQLPPHLIRGIPGRKVSQLEAMASAVVATNRGTQWLEWCAGKGYLGRILASTTQKKVVSFEYQTALCEAGQSFALQHRLPITFVQGDAFLSSSKQAIAPDTHALALHACGDLHVKLIQYGTELQIPALTLAPCCYHLIASDNYVPMSNTCRNAQLKLTKEELRIPLQETVTGGQRVKRHRQQEMIYRLGVDLIFREYFGDVDYVPIPSIKKSLLAQGFKHFVCWAAQHKGRYIGELDFDDYFCRAEQKFYQMEKISLVQQPFYSILEAWVVLDKVLYLQQHNYQVQLRQFCSKQITPRNLLIQAWL